MDDPSPSCLCLWKCGMFFNPLHPKSDKHLISPNSITPESNIKVTEIKEMITKWRSSWLLNKFSLPLMRSTVGVLRPLKLLCTWSIPIATGIYGIKLVAYTYIYMNVLKHAIFQLNRQPFYLLYILLCYLDSLSRNIAFKVMTFWHDCLKSRLNKRNLIFLLGLQKTVACQAQLMRKYIYAWLTGKSSCPVGWDKCFLLVCLVQKIDFSSLKDIPFTCRSVSGRWSIVQGMSTQETETGGFLCMLLLATIMCDVQVIA